ncbi:UNVERIFIED_CONTAM: hypothetical protein Slati_3152400 [Sesamum latifolium]|uniref:Retrotransposon gag domain-containing protein n=1 Tax=Sesamum latifolium TaxID=2727402 RepID=A0AAW2UWI4_9LAMI
MEHLSRFENAALLHHYTDGIKYRVFVTTFARAAQQWFNQLPVGAIGNFQEFRSLFLHQFASSRKLRKTELSLFAVRQKDDEPLKEYLRRFTAAALEVPAATQEVKASAFSQGLLDGDFFKSLARSQLSSLTPFWPEQQSILTWKRRRRPRRRPGRRSVRRSRRRYPPRNLVSTLEKENPIFKEPEVLAPYQKKDGDKTSSPKRSSRKGAKQTSGSKEENDDIPRKGVIRMIAGGPSGGDSHQARKSQVREAHQISIKEVLDVETMEDAPLIQFGRAERSGPQIMHNDALVITVILANYEVGRIFIDSGSSADILFGEAYNQMQLRDVSLEKVNTSLYGFAGEVVHPRGMVSLPLTMGRGTARKTCLLKFLVVDVPSATM